MKVQITGFEGSFSLLELLVGLIVPEWIRTYPSGVGYVPDYLSLRYRNLADCEQRGKQNMPIGEVEAYPLDPYSPLLQFYSPRAVEPLLSSAVPPTACRVPHQESSECMLRGSTCLFPMKLPSMWFGEGRGV
jgi:hypothetical protein